MNKQYKIITYENKNFKIGKTGERLLNYILKDPKENNIIIISTYFKSKLKYYTKLADIPSDKIDILLNLLKQYTWTIESSKGIKTYIKENKPISLRNYLKKELLDLFSEIHITVDTTPYELKSYIESIHKTLN